MSFYTTCDSWNTTCIAPAGQDGKHVLHTVYQDQTHTIFSYMEIKYFTSSDAKHSSRTVRNTVNENCETL